MGNQSAAISWYKRVHKCDSVEKDVLQKVNLLRENIGVTKPPVLVAKFLNAFFVRKVITVDLPPRINENFDGSIQPSKEGFIVKVNTNHLYERQRFSIAHELIHTLFYDTSVLPPKRPYRSESNIQEEKICNVGAAELLVPSTFISEIIGRYKFSIKSLLVLASIFCVSPRVMSMRLIDLGLWDANILYYRLMQESDTNKPTSLRIEWFATKRYWIPKMDGVDNEIILEAFKEKSYKTGIADLYIGNMRGDFFIECLRLGNGVLCLIEDKALHESRCNDGQLILT